jgi:hypothetical protein
MQILAVKTAVGCLFRRDCVGRRDGLDLQGNQVTLVREEFKEQMASQENKDLKGYRDCQGL